MKLIEADDYRRRYLTSHASLAAARAPDLGLPAATSSCCQARTTISNGKLICLRCRERCRNGERYVPRTMAHRGGGKYIRVRETRPVNRGDGFHRGMWSYIRWMRPMRELFALPIGADPYSWARVLIAWDFFLGVDCQGGSYELAARAGGRQTSPDERALWTADNVGVWVNCGRRVVVRRLTGDEIPGPRAHDALVAVGAS